MLAKSCRVLPFTTKRAGEAGNSLSRIFLTVSPRSLILQTPVWGGGQAMGRYLETNPHEI